MHGTFDKCLGPNIARLSSPVSDMWGNVGKFLNLGVVCVGIPLNLCRKVLCFLLLPLFYLLTPLPSTFLTCIPSFLCSQISEKIRKGCSVIASNLMFEGGALVLSHQRRQYEGLSF
jgi:hypothetical protein